MIINDVHQGVHTRKKRKRVGRGTGSGRGKTCGRGHKGAGSRSGFSRRRGFIGGQMPLARLIAKRGFNNNQFATKVLEINVDALDRKFDDGSEVTPDTLKESGLAKGRFDVIKILGNGELSKKLSVRVHRVSKSAEAKIAAAGGSVEKLV
ncbi:MAG: 50S ribosomal protein L15 [Planctomycetota bacterium]|nr:MAG: 50S ribosomal protein L15 [Planctomycetota bacterium]REJ93065.1 MAG: 50S ribosomal protein L15 [Planctomycetota bacterium]REK30053.1 MAG: 50S ribosomal protein L15 [Planctomycetota bacterium]REK37705.1 MAG: 50S ribosomal protein L15 [Planctomycetota bacterium]